LALLQNSLFGKKYLSPWISNLQGQNIFRNKYFFLEIPTCNKKNIFLNLSNKIFLLAVKNHASLIFRLLIVFIEKREVSELGF